MRSFFLTVGTILSFFSFGILSASADCQPGYGECPSYLGGGCAPLGSVCCPGGTYAPGGSVCCEGERHCEAGYICGEGNECIPKSSERVCRDGHSFCDPGYSCGSDKKCHPVASTAPQQPSGGSNDQGSGVTDATQCISVKPVRGKSSYKVYNSCTFGVNVRLQTKEITKQSSIDSYYIGAGDQILTYSYFGYTPVIVRACGKGSIC